MTYNLENKTVIVTGANSGIGKSAVIQLAKLGAKVIMACRSLDRGSTALEEVQKASSSKDVELMQVDMSSQEFYPRICEIIYGTVIKGWMFSSITLPILIIP